MAFQMQNAHTMLKRNTNELRNNNIIFIMYIVYVSYHKWFEVTEEQTKNEKTIRNESEENM